MNAREPRATTIADTVEQSTQSSGAADHFAPQVEFVGESRPKLSLEIQTVLRRRLRNALVLLVVAEAVFLARQLIFEDVRVDSIRWTVGIQGLVLVLILCLTVVLFGRRKLSLEQLRRIELTVFALVGLVLALVQHMGMTRNLQRGASEWAMFNLMLSICFWFGLMCVYGMFIPNTWQRAAVITGVMAATPLVVLLADLTLDPAIRALIHPNAMVTLVLLMALGCASASYGTYTIGSLRRAAFVARQLGQYRLRQLLGAGGMGEVYLAEHLLLKRRCAIKMIRPGIATDPRVLARFEREVRATAELTHWNTVEIYDYGRADDGTFYYVMEFLPGMNLAEIVERTGPLPAERAIHLFRQVCAALREAHQVGLIHRDIKPANIFVANLGGLHDVVKLLDFGLVKPRPHEVSPRVTQDGLVAGSPLYMAPEQAMGSHEPDARSDVYALGAAAYFAVTGRPPFDGRNALEILVRHARDPVVPPRTLVPALPADLEAVILRCLAKEPDERFATIGDVDRALARCQAAADWTEERAATWWQATRQASPAA